MKIARGGMRFDAAKYIEPVRRLAIEEIRNRRESLELPKETIRGARFKSDEGVLWRIESNYTEEEFMGCPRVAVDTMLIDAAESDWWYTYEKDYGDEDYGGDDDDI